MLQKTIKQILTKKIDKWLNTIQDQKVINAIEKDLIITGGCFPSMIQNEEPNDYDCYLRTKESAIIVAQYYATVWNEMHPKAKDKVLVLDCDNPSDEILKFFNTTKANLDTVKDRRLRNLLAGRVKMVYCAEAMTAGVEDANGSEELGFPSNTVLQAVEEIDELKEKTLKSQTKQPFDPVFVSANAITLTEGIQIVVRFYGEPDTVHETFDFVHTRAYYDRGSRELNIPNEVYETVTNRTLLYTGSLYPICSLFRLRKFLARGWTINAGQQLKMAMQISELDLMDVNVLEDQLIGVDSLYFMTLIEQFRIMEDKNDGFELSSEYIVSIIDKVF